MQTATVNVSSDSLFYLISQGSIELRLSDMVRAAKSSEQCSVKLARDKASPRFSIFRSKRMKGWWPLIKLKSQDDIEREEREAELEKKKKKKKKQSKRSQMKPEDLQFVDSSGNTFLLMVLNKDDFSCYYKNDYDC